MGQTISHRPRLAWDGARAVTAAIEAGEHAWLAGQLAERFGVEHRRHLEDSWLRVTLNPDSVLTEAGLWRARLDDIMARQPELMPQVAALIEETATFLRSV